MHMLWLWTEVIFKLSWSSYGCFFSFSVVDPKPFGFFYPDLTDFFLDLIKVLDPTLTVLFLGANDFKHFFHGVFSHTGIGTFQKCFLKIIFQLLIFFKYLLWLWSTVSDTDPKPWVPDQTKSSGSMPQHWFFCVDQNNWLQLVPGIHHLQRWLQSSLALPQMSGVWVEIRVVDPDSMTMWIRIQEQENKVKNLPFSTSSTILEQKVLFWIRIRIRIRSGSGLS
jgi:hypothetical protein